MNYNKAKYKYGKFYTRKCRKSDRIVGGELGYAADFHFRSRSILKDIRKVANQNLRRYKGEVGDYGWYKKFYDVWWIAF